MFLSAEIKVEIILERFQIWTHKNYNDYDLNFWIYFLFKILLRIKNNLTYKKMLDDKRRWLKKICRTSEEPVKEDLQDYDVC